MDGIVASPAEAAAVRRIVGPDIAIVTPGIRPAGQRAGDQKRIATPAAAIRAGADYLVVGRPITAARRSEGARPRRSSPRSHGALPAEEESDMAKGYWIARVDDHRSGDATTPTAPSNGEAFRKYGGALPGARRQRSRAPEGRVAAAQRRHRIPELRRRRSTATTRRNTGERHGGAGRRAELDLIIVEGYDGAAALTSAAPAACYRASAMESDR